MTSGPTWARRYTMQSPRLCARPGCQSPAEATLRFHSTRREARLVDVDDGRPSSGDLCERHACVLTLPRGWRLCDHRNLTVADAITRRMVFAPRGERGLGLTSRAGKWGLGSMPEYLARGDGQCLRMIQLEDWATLEAAAQFAALEHVNGIFTGLQKHFGNAGGATKVAINLKRRMCIE